MITDLVHCNTNGSIRWAGVLPAWAARGGGRGGGRVSRLARVPARVSSIFCFITVQLINTCVAVSVAVTQPAHGDTTGGVTRELICKT